MVFSYSLLFLFELSCILILPLWVVLQLMEHGIDFLDACNYDDALLENDRDDQFNDN